MTRRPEDVPYYNIEQDELRKSLDRLDVSADAHPSKIPGVDVLQVQPEYLGLLPEDFMIEVTGMPNTGKTTFAFDEWQTLGRNLHNVWAIEKIKMLENSLSPEIRHHLRQSIIRQEVLRIQSQTDPRYIFHPRRKEPILMEHGAIDRAVWNRVYFQNGDIHADVFRMGNKYNISITPPIEIPIGAVIIFMASPEVSLSRDHPREKESPVSNLPFLQILYQQYLRLYEELLSQRFTSLDVTEVDLPVPMVITLNMEDDLDECYGKFAGAMEQILKLTGRI